jgi:multidrug resistance efflux pump
MKEDKPFSTGIILVASLGILCLTIGLLFLRLEITTKGSGRIAARTDHVLYAPRLAHIEKILVQPSDSVKQGDLLMVLSTPDLQTEILRLKEVAAEARLDATSAELKLGELAITGGMAEALQAEEAQAILTEIASVHEAIGTVYKEAAEKGMVTRIQELEKMIQGLRGNLDKLETRRLITLKNSGLPAILKDRETVRLQNARTRIELLDRQIALREKELQSLRIHASSDGLVSDIYVRHVGKLVQAGEPLLTLVQPQDGYEVKASIDDRNLDLVRIGMPVRLESKVYQSNREGYMWGTVRQIVKDNLSATQSGFEVTVDIDSYPLEPVIGSRVDFEIIITDGDPLRALLNNPARQKQTAPASAR